ncbi:hypothetical protein DFJ58DRAFT_727029 [Suillus subalutaceus]|uniref:uncharacterized protein n=1 Tax=Suillus subalutaceus TaxID=48586 RepID=UPI001B8684F8|nr:uncharacterized protein DFJ58DRAFT_727029 [Suillus subalutaceus]KAG1857012.1 hypothetical protein DFJ58DRAFT_727029 [Suillus subalutaceus]
MYDPVDSSGMPLRIADSVPRFAGDYTQLVNFLESVEQLTQPLGLTDKEIIKYALKYTAPKQRQLLSYYEGDNYVEFADHVLYFYLECGVDHYTRPIFEKPATIEAPIASAPPQPECTQDQPAVEVIAPIPEVCNAAPTPVVPEVPLDITTPPSVQLEARIISTPQEPISAPEYPLAKDIPPKLEVCEPITIPILPEAPLEEIILPSVSDDFKHLLHFSAPIPEPSEVSEVQYALLSDQVMSLETPSVADASALVALSVCSDHYHPQVQYPCTIPPPVSDDLKHLSEVSDDFKHLSVVRDDFKHLLHISVPIPESSVVSEAHNALLSDQVKSLVTPSIAIHSALVALSAHSDHYLQVQYPCTIPPTVSDDSKYLSSVRDDSKHLSHPNAPIPESSVASEVRNAPLSDQVKSLVTLSIAIHSALVALSARSDYHPQVQHPCTISPSVSDDFKHLSSVRDDFKHPLHLNTPLSDQSISLVTPSITDHSALSTYSEYRLPVKHPCIASLIHQLEHVSDDSDAPPVRRHTPEVAQVMHLEALYIHPRSISHFSFISCLKLSRIQMPVAIISPSYPQHFIVDSSFTRRIRAPRALFPALYATIIAEESSCYRIFTVSSVFSHVSLVQNQSHFNSPSMRSLCARLAYIYTPSALIIVFNFASFTFIRISPSSIYHVNIILECPIKGYPFMSWRQLAIDLESIRCSRTLSAPNNAYHSSHWDLVWTWIGSLSDRLASPYTPADILDMDIIAQSSPRVSSHIRTSRIFTRLTQHIHTILALSVTSIAEHPLHDRHHHSSEFISRFPYKSHFAQPTICDAFSRFSHTFPRSRTLHISHASSHLVTLSSEHTHIMPADHHAPISPTSLEILTRRALSGDTQYSKSPGDVETRVSAGSYGLILQILTTGLHGTTCTIIHYDFPIERTTSHEMRHRRNTFPHNAQYSHMRTLRAFSRLSALRRASSRSIHPSSNQSLGMSLFVI